MESKRKGLFEPECIVDDLTFNGVRLRFTRRTAHLLAIGIETLGDLAALDDDDRRLRDTRVDRLADEEQATKHQEMKERRTKQGRPFEVGAASMRTWEAIVII